MLTCSASFEIFFIPGLSISPPFGNCGLLLSHAFEIISVVLIESDQRLLGLERVEGPFC